MKNNFYKENPTDKIWWVDDGSLGDYAISFDREKVYYIFKDYPWKFSKEEKELFDKENPYWADFFKDRTETKECFW